MFNNIVFSGVSFWLANTKYVIFFCFNANLASHNALVIHEPRKLTKPSALESPFQGQSGRKGSLAGRAVWQEGQSGRQSGRLRRAGQAGRLRRAGQAGRLRRAGQVGRLRRAGQAGRLRRAGQAGRLSRAGQAEKSWPG